MFSGQRNVAVVGVGFVGGCFDCGGLLMTFVDYLIFNFCVAGGVASFISCVFMGIWMADCLHDHRYKQATIAGLLLALTVSSACVAGAYGCMIGDRMFEHKNNAGSFAKGGFE